MDYGKTKGKIMVLTAVFALAHELLERVVQDIHSHQEFVLLNILKGYVA